ncbi:MAG: D-glucuronyl C5-epimerase family protein [Thermoplasmata archaeon]
MPKAALPKYPLTWDDPRRLIRDDSFGQTVFGEDGVVMFRYRAQGNVARHNPVTVAMYALANYNAHRDMGASRFLADFNLHVQWLLRSFTARGDWGAWYYEHDYTSPAGDCQAPWASSMAQGAGISALIRYHALTDESPALEVARRALGAYRVPIADGGVLYEDPDGLTWFEEYACPGGATTLNGFIIALLGAQELASHAGEEEGQELFETGLRTLETRLGDFELRLPFMRWSRYDNRDIVHAGRKYHGLHVRQLRVLADLVEGPEGAFLRRYLARWSHWQEVYGTSPLFRPYEVLCRGWTKVRSGLRRWGG